ncbi:uncharacterized protein N7477_008918 [Penicillium maclennaniae]|uniref:uncharacterized protein n=1 Tax=Penicillium maclennaniae TaxID=1343394 RepID=UPI00254006A6|nr:uncharacterized protein N7477_008918 [Penicillium maclennaniae]KAJ5666470.1 hypothetical protein N7477_008918 [Penicillium maclennaniae]
MSQSQHSDFASSLYDDEIDNLSYLAASNPPATPSGNFLRPLRPVVPSSFTRVGPDRRKAFVLYEKMIHNDWVEWWLETDYGRKSKINWDSTRHAQIWSHFKQVAHSLDGAPKVICERCGAILEHPYTVNLRSKGRV